MASTMHPGIANAFHGSSVHMKQALDDVKGTGNYYVSHELGSRMNGIENGVNHMRLDSDFLNSSKEWGAKFDNEALNREKAESASKIAEGAGFIGNYKSNFEVPKVQKMEENQVREMHEWAGRNLNGVNQDLHPYAKSAQGRINQFSDYIGVTDRYTGYRNNLTRASRDPTKLGMEWLKGVARNPYETSLHQGVKQAGQTFLPASLPKKRINEAAAYTTVDNLNPIHNNGIKRYGGSPQRSIQERCGINTTFPGITEYMKRYNKKQLPEKVSAFTLNPTPDFSIYGRPTARIEWSANPTEYQTRYEWPDGSKITKKPWLRK